MVSPEPGTYGVAGTRPGALLSLHYVPPRIVSERLPVDDRHVIGAGLADSPAAQQGARAVRQAQRGCAVDRDLVDAVQAEQPAREQGDGLRRRVVPRAPPSGG